MKPAYLRKHYALPAEHGAWIWLLGPLVLGAAAARRFSPDLLLLLGAGLAVFLLRQPLTLAVKSLSGRRGGDQLQPALAWATAYGLAAIVFLLPLVLRGHARLLWLGLPGLAVFGLHLRLVSQRRERRQPGVEILAAGALALGAPAAYWVAGGPSTGVALLLWLIAWFQAAASIVHVYLRLVQRDWAPAQPIGVRLHRGARSLAYHGFNLIASLAIAGQTGGGWLLPAAFLLTAADSFDGVLRPAAGARPAAIGLRQLLVSSLFYLLSSASFWLR